MSRYATYNSRCLPRCPRGVELGIARSDWLGECEFIDRHLSPEIVSISARALSRMFLGYELLAFRALALRGSS